MNDTEGRLEFHGKVVCSLLRFSRSSAADALRTTPSASVSENCITVVEFFFQGLRLEYSLTIIYYCHGAISFCH